MLARTLKSARLLNSAAAGLLLEDVDLVALFDLEFRWSVFRVDALTLPRETQGRRFHTTALRVRAKDLPQFGVGANLEERLCAAL